MVHVTDIFREKLFSLIEGEFWDNQVEHDIEMDLLPIMELEIADKAEELMELMDAFMEWQIDAGKGQ